VAEAFRLMPQHRLRIIGDGANMPAVRRAAGDAANITFLGRVDQPTLIREMQQAAACIHAAEEDFGIAIVEAQACGTPMIAFGRGGARDIIRPPPAAAPTGLLFAEQTPRSLIDAVGRFAAMRAAFSPQACRANAERFGEALFRTRMQALVARHMERSPCASR
jgi:glycosyltransferase involved in cell wall biosynthesis